MIVPELSVSDIRKSLEFYTDVLGFKLNYQRIEDEFAYLVLEDNEIMIEQRNENWFVGELEYPFGRGMNLEIGVTYIDPILKKIKSRSLNLFKDVFESSYKADDKIYHVREFLIQDPDGYLLRFSEALV